MRGFKKCSICNAVDGTEDGMLWEGSEGDGNVRSELISSIHIQVIYRRYNMGL